MRVFLTGGTGLIGSHVADRLRGRGDDVVALVRPSSDTTHLESLGCELVAGDVLDDPATQAARMRGCTAVVHCAARVFTAGSREAFLRDNVEGTERVLAAAAETAPRVVHLSSVAVYAGLPMDGRPLTEERWAEADPERQHAYAASKLLSERAAWRLHEEGRVRLTTVRPCVVYGERDRAATPLIVRVATLPLVPLPGGGRTWLPLVYAGNVAAGIVAALDLPVSEGRAYNLARDERVVARDLIRWIQEELGSRRPALTIPGIFPAAVAAALERLGPVLPGVGRLGVIRALRSLIVDNPYDSGPARRDLGWSTHVSHREGVRRTLGWWRARSAERPSRGHNLRPSSRRT